MSNRKLILVAGTSTTGKSMSLRNIRNQDKWLYLNCEGGKELPFPHQFRSATVLDPLQIIATLKKVKEWQGTDKEIEGVIIDSITFMMDMYESQYVLTADNTRDAWKDYSQFWKELVHEHIAALNCAVVLIGHNLESYTDKGEMRIQVPVKGSLKNQGLEAYLTTIVYTERQKPSVLQAGNKFESPLLTYDEDEIEDDVKYVFKTRPDHAGERIRSPLKMFSRKERYIDNCVQAVLDRIGQYYTV